MRRFIWLLLILNGPALVCFLILVTTSMSSGHIPMLLFWLYITLTPYFFLPAMASGVLGVPFAFYPFGWAILPSGLGLVFTFAFNSPIAVLVNRLVSAWSSAKEEFEGATVDPVARDWRVSAGRGVLALLLGLTLVMAPTQSTCSQMEYSS